MAKILIFDGKKVNVETKLIEDHVKKIQNSRAWLHSKNVDDLIEYFDKLGKFWTSEFKDRIGPNSRYVSYFLSKRYMKNKLDVALHGNRHALDTFVDLGDDELLFHAQPRGVISHWIAGNVDLLGIFSAIQALITKNVSIIKAPAKHDLLIELLDSFSKVDTDEIKGNDILHCIQVVYLRHDDTDNQTILSKAADVRVAWGGWEAVNSIISLPKSPFTEDIVYGPKYSYIIIDEVSLKNNLNQIVQKIAIDVSMFDQYACSSPHTVLIDTKNDEIIDSFAKHLAKALDDVNRILLPKQTMTEEKSLEIISLRAESSLTGRVYSSKGVEWTVVSSNETTLAKPVFSRVVHVHRLDYDKLINENNSRKIQTIGIVMDKDKRLQLVDKLTLHGGDRCPNVGSMSLFDSPWDGMFGMERMVRWVTTYKR